MVYKYTLKLTFRVGTCALCALVVVGHFSAIQIKQLYTLPLMKILDRFMTDHGAEGGVNERKKFFLAAQQNNLILTHVT